MALYTSNLFRPLTQHQPVTVLLLIENSQRMDTVWQELRDVYLVRLLDTIVSNSSVATSVSVIESDPIDNGANSSAPRQYSGTHDALYNINFNTVSDCRISAGRVNECIDYLDTSTYSIGQPSSSLHLVIIAASSPTDDCSGMPIPSSGNFSPWILLAGKLAKRNIHCHLVMSRSTLEDAAPLTTLFEETLQMQHNVEETPPFPVDHSRTAFRLSARPTYNPYNEPEPSLSPYAPQQRLAAPPRRNSYPLDNFYPEPFDESAAPMSSHEGDAPSLVSQLQQVHGLTKKKVYGTKPARQPFIRDERVRDSTSGATSTTLPSPTAPSPPSSLSASTTLTGRYRKPTPLTTSLGMSGVPLSDSIPSPTQGGRAMSQSRVDRIQRLNQAASGSSPTDLHAHGRRAAANGVVHGALAGNVSGHGAIQGVSTSGHGWHQRRGSRLSTPEPEGMVLGSPVSSSGGSLSGSGTLVPAVLGSNAGSGPGLSLGLGSMPSTSLPGSTYNDISPGSGSSYVSSDMSSPVTPGSMEDLFGHASSRMNVHQSHPQSHSGIPVYSAPTHGVPEAWSTQQHQQVQLQQHQQRQLQHIQEVHAMQHQQQAQAQAHQLQQMQEVHAIQQQNQLHQQNVHAQTQAHYLNHPAYNPSAQTYFPPVHPPPGFYADASVEGMEMQGQQQTGMSESMAQVEMQVQHEQIELQRVQLQHVPQTKIQQSQQYTYGSNVPISSSPPPMVPSQGPRAAGPEGSSPNLTVSESTILHGTALTRTSPPLPAVIPPHSRSRANSLLLSNSASAPALAVTPTSTTSSNSGTPTKASHRGSKHKKSSSLSHAQPSSTNTTSAVTVSNPSSSATLAATNDDEERFTFGKDFVAATVALFEEEVLPAYPDFPGMSSGLLNGSMAGEAAGSVGAAGAGELYATRQKVKGAKGGAPMGAVLTTGQNLPGVTTGGGPVNHANGYGNTTTTGASTALRGPPPIAAAVNRASYSYGAPSYPHPHGSSLTGWAG